MCGRLNNGTFGITINEYYLWETRSQTKGQFPDFRALWVVVVTIPDIPDPDVNRQIFLSSQEITWKDFDLKILKHNAVDKIVVVNKETAREINSSFDSNATEWQ